MSNVDEQLRKYGVTLTVTHEEHEEMTDIVERLRTRDPSLHIGAMCHEAADEIMRLRERLLLAQGWCSVSADEIERLHIAVKDLKHGKEMT